MKQQTKVHDKQCPKCNAYGYELQKFVKAAEHGTEIVECVICNHQYTVKA